MSQVVKAIVAVDTGQRKVFNDKQFSPLFQNVFEKKEAIEDIASTSYLTGRIYKIGITLGHTTMVTDDLNSTEDELELAVERTKKSVIEAIFGEFRSDFLQINNALYDRDFQKAQALLVQFERKMYEV